MNAKQSKSKKATRRSRRGKYAGLAGVSINPSIFPPLFAGECLYADSFALAPAAGAPATQVYRMNSVYDPNFTGAGSTVLGYTQLSALYGRYRVLSAAVELEYTNTSTTVPLTAFVVLSNANSLSLDITKIMGSRFMWMKNLPVIAGSSSASHKLRVPIHTIYGVPALQVRNEDDFAGLVGGNPNNVVYAHVGVISDAGAAGSADIKIRIVYNVIWSLPVEQSY